MYLYAKVANLPNDPKLFTCGGGGIHTKKHIHTLFPFGWLAKQTDHTQEPKSVNKSNKKQTKESEGEEERQPNILFEKRKKECTLHTDKYSL